ncbi:MAG TPA: hypothetical protein VF892_05195 [Pseudonocardiaceae bacterium]
MLRSWLTAVVLAGTSLLLAGHPAHAQQVCDPASLAGGEACFYAGRQFTGAEFDLSIPLGRQLPVPGDGNCTDLPTGIGLAGSVSNTSGDTLYVLPVSCPDSHPGAAPSAIVLPHYSGDVLALTNTTGTHSVRMCGPGLALDPLALTCAFPR